MTNRRAAALWTLFAAIAAVSAALVLRRPAADRLSDLHIYYGAIQAMQSGQPLYAYAAENGGPFTYPPFAALLLQPITLLPESALQLLWLAAVCAAIAAIAVALARALAPTSQHALAAGAIACVILLSAPAQSNLRFGQISIFIVLLALIDGIGLTPARYRGILIGIAAAIKLTPLLFVAFFLISRRYRDAGRAAATFGGCAVLAALLLPGESWQYWTATMLQTSRIGDLASLGNQSVHGMLLRLGAEPRALPLIWAALVAVICGAALLRARQLQINHEPVRAAVLVGCATVAASPVSWTHHQVWTVLAAMLLLAVPDAQQRLAGILLLLAMTASLGVVLRGVSLLPGVQFLLENARAFGAVAICLAGFGGAAALAVTRRRAGRVWLRAATVALATITGFAIMPLPAGADPTFKAYTAADLSNPRYFFACHNHTTCTGLAEQEPAGEAVSFAIAREKTKVRVNGVADDTVRRLEFQSAPGGPPVDIPLVPVYPGQRAFSFRSASLAAGQLIAYGSNNQILVAFDSMECLPECR